MSDYEKLAPSEQKVSREVDHTTQENYKCKNKRRGKKLHDRDDLTGMALNMVNKIDFTELLVIWIVFLFIHSEMFAVQILQRFNGTTNDDKTMTMKGTLYSSIIMIITVICCSFWRV